MGGGSVKKNINGRGHLFIAQIEDAAHRELGQCQEPEGNIAAARHWCATDGESGTAKPLSVVAHGLEQRLEGGIVEPLLEEKGTGEVAIGNPHARDRGAIGVN